MRVLLINEVFGTTSTGKICAQIAEKIESEGAEVKVAFGRWASVPEKYKRFAYYFGSDFEVKMHGIKTRLFDAQGLGSKKATRKFLEWADDYNPDLLWLHNIHGYYVNYPLLFQWIKSRPQMKVQWTLHDCWAFTGHCVYFSMARCDKWKTGCQKCSQKKEYPASLFLDRSIHNYQEKKEAFCGVRNMKLITPSRWLADLVRQSFLQEYPVEVKYNTIDKDVFKPTKSDFKKKYGIEDKKMILGVSNAWQESRKGLKDFCDLAKMLNNEYVIVLVGLTKKLMRTLPNKIIGVQKIENAKELAEIYTAADVFVNPSYEETFGMTTIEAMACGTDAIVYKDTACEEIVNMYGGKAVEQGAINIYNAIIQKFV